MKSPVPSNAIIPLRLSVLTLCTFPFLPFSVLIQTCTTLLTTWVFPFLLNESMILNIL